jgi:hypothetical protein
MPVAFLFESDQAAGGQGERGGWCGPAVALLTARS